MDGVSDPILPEENVQQYPRPPVLQPAGAEVVICFGGQEVARTSDALRALETHHAPTYYLPRDAFLPELFSPAPGSTVCEWKGVASYFDVRLGGRVAPRAAWTYAAPVPRFAALAGHIAVYPGAMDLCTVAGVAVTPQPGDFYGGWVTPNLRGIVKGGPGTQGW